MGTVIASIGGDEVDQRFRSAQVRAEVLPAGVRSQCGARVVAARSLQAFIDLLAQFVEGRQADIATTRDVQRGEVERGADQRLLQRRGDEFVDLVGLLTQQTQRDRRSAKLLVERRVEERVEQVGIGAEGFDIAVFPGLLAVDVGHRDLQLFGQHRVAKAEDRLGEFDAHVRMNVGRVRHEFGQQHRQRTDIVVDGDVVVFAFGDQATGLEQIVAVPGNVIGGIDVDACDVEDMGDAIAVDIVDPGHAIAVGSGVAGPFVDIGRHFGVARSGSLHRCRFGEDRIHHVAGLQVVLFVEDVVHRRQADVFVGAAVTRNKVDVERIAGRGHRIGGRVHVGKHRLVGAHHGAVFVAHERIAGVLVGQAGPAHRHVSGPDRSVGGEQQLAGVVDPDCRHVVDVAVDQLDADPQRVELEVGPGRHVVRGCRRHVGVERVGQIMVGIGGAIEGGDIAVFGAVDQEAGGAALVVILAQEGVDRGVAAIGLALVDQIAGVVVVHRRLAGQQVAVRIEVAGRVRKARPVEVHHVRSTRDIFRVRNGVGFVEPLRHVERIARRKLDRDEPATLRDEVQAVIEELAEGDEEFVEGRATQHTLIADEGAGGGTRLRIDRVADSDLVTAGPFGSGVHRRDGCRVVDRAERIGDRAGNQVGDQARHRVHHHRSAHFHRVVRIDHIVGRALVGFAGRLGVEQLQERRVGGGSPAQRVGTGGVVAELVIGADQVVVGAADFAHTRRVERAEQLGVVGADLHLLEDVGKIDCCKTDIGHDWTPLDV